MSKTPTLRSVLPEVTLRRVLHEEAEAILQVAERLGSSFVKAIDWMVNCQGRVLTCGLGKSGHIARKTAGTLSSTGTPSHFLHAAEALHGDLGMATSQDIVLLYTYSGETDEIVQLFPALQSVGARTILLTGRPESSAGRVADVVLDCGVVKEACPNGLAPTTSTTVMLAVSDALAVAVMEQRGFGAEDFARLHPSGTLGRRLLLKVRDVMRGGDDLPMVFPETGILDVMRAITRAGAGAACVVSPENELLGLISDGDLRRHLVSHDKPLEACAQDLMTPNPSTIDAELLAIDALEFFQNLPKKIGELPVIDNSRVVGLLTLKDLLRSGIL